MISFRHLILSLWVIKPLGEDSTPATVKPLPVSLVEPVAYRFSYTTQTDDFNPGWLGKLFGAERSGLKITVSSTQAAGTTSSETQTINWELHSGTAERFVVELWRDRLFGTFAFRQEPVNPTPRLQGIAKAADGSPLKNQAVKLVVNGKTYSALSDKNGHYAFYARKIPAGTASLQVAHQAPKTVTIAAP